MRSRRGTNEHQEAVSRRLAQLSAELASTRASTAREGLEVEAHEQTTAPAVGGEWWHGHTRPVADRPPLQLVPEIDSPPEVAPAVAPAVVPAAVSPIPRPAAPEPVKIPTPGRHADRRQPAWRAADLWPSGLRGRIALGPQQVAVVAVLVALGLAVTTWWVIRGDSEAVPVTAPVPVPASSAAGLMPVPSGGVSQAPATAAATGEVTVDVAGKVRRPGIAVLEPGARVIDAIKAAGGARPGVALTSINLARQLVDGEQILVGLPSSGQVTAPVPGSPPGSTSGSPVGALVNLNSATSEQLETLPQVGPVTAAAILAWRDAHGGFTNVDELLEVDGIGDATLAQVKPFVTV